MMKSIRRLASGASKAPRAMPRATAHSWASRSRCTALGSPRKSIVTGDVSSPTDRIMPVGSENVWAGVPNRPAMSWISASNWCEGSPEACSDLASAAKSSTCERKPSDLGLPARTFRFLSPGALDMEPSRNLVLEVAPAYRYRR